MKTKQLTSSELLVLGLVAEMPRHGYELEQIIDQRNMREWTQIGFSSIYFVLGKLEKKDLVAAAKPTASKAKKSYTITAHGQKTLHEQTLAALQTFQASYSSLLIGMLNWPTLQRDEAMTALKNRQYAVADELSRIQQIRFEQQPLPDYLDTMFDFSTGQLTAESEWINSTLEYMENKIWLE